jgi:hypothetical protein
MPITLNNAGTQERALPPTAIWGAIHDFVTLNGLSDAPAACSARPQDLLRSPRALALSRIGAPELAGFNRQISPSGKPIMMTQWERARFRQ